MTQQLNALLLLCLVIWPRTRVLTAILPRARVLTAILPRTRVLTAILPRARVLTVILPRARVLTVIEEDGARDDVLAGNERVVSGGGDERVEDIDNLLVSRRAEHRHAVVSDDRVSASAERHRVDIGAQSRGHRVDDAEHLAASRHNAQ